ncbi:hypothetical protein PIIN_07597 [Serendipita indica DSM 11827]|uniref:Uncharacterized protein n=1 Tax=Serendipita indica (strain DSM 11827) TaxID=1109443 RepID=G4TQQ1_SERID|nr:hypothetical protein PIIN_07597 [Serendipita indica DSM 11827]
MRGYWNSFTPRERRNMAVYILGIMLYKLGLESFATRSVLATAILVFGLTTSLLLILDACTGGKPKFLNGGKLKYGTWDPNLLFPLYMVSGIAYGMVELIRRTIPRDIVELRMMDATVHMLYEISGTSGAFLSSRMIGIFGNNFSFMITPPLFIVAGIIWSFIDKLDQETSQKSDKYENYMPVRRSSYMQSIIVGTRAFMRSTYKGAIICFSHRRFIWLLPGYSLALYGHRYLENALAPAIAKRIMLDSSYSQIMVTGSNLGELFGAMFVLLTTSYIQTPLPFLRFDALALAILWVLPSYSRQIQPHQVVYAWRIAAMFIPVSMGWAAGDVSLAAFIQSSLQRLESTDSQVSALGSVMAFLYSSYIIMYAILGSMLGTYIDKVYKEDGNIYRALVNVGGVHFTVLAGIIMLATLTPRGAWALNPSVINDIKREDSDEGDLEEQQRNAPHHEEWADGTHRSGSDRGEMAESIMLEEPPKQPEESARPPEIYIHIAPVPRSPVYLTQRTEPIIRINQ